MSNNNFNKAYGFNNSLQTVFNPPIISQRNPLGTDHFQLGQVWINEVANTIFTLTSNAAGAAVWTGNTGGAPGAFATVTAVTTIDAGTAITAGTSITAGTNLVATAGSVTAGTSVAAGTTITAGTNLVATAGSVTAGTSVTAATTVAAGTNITAAGNITAGNNITATGGNITVTAGNLVVTAGNETIAAGNLTVSMGDIIVTAGSITAGDTITADHFVTNIGDGPAEIFAGNGDPNGVHAAPTGSLFMRLDPAGAASRLYINTNGAMVWTNFTAAA